jgi:RNA 2',3'-cyclic 3'-phosphodiesterase
VSSAASVGGDELRLFCGLRLPEHVVERIAGWQERELSGGRAVPSGNLHVTLAFLGRRPRSDVGAVFSAVERATSLAPYRFQVDRYRETRSVGMLTLRDQGGKARAFAEQLHELLELLGVYEREKRPWLPHLTVLRFRERPRLVPSLPDLGEFSPSEAAVYHSVLRPSGAQYEILESVALGG